MLARVKQFIQNTFKNKDLVLITRNVVWLIGERSIKLLLGLIVGIWVTRYLGPERYGILSYVISFSILFTSFASFGIDNLVVRDLVNNRDKTNAILGTAFSIKIFGGCLALFVSLLGAFFLDMDFTTRLYIGIVIGSTIVKSLNIIDFYFQSLVKSKSIVKANTISLIVSSTLKIALILIEAPLLYFVVVVLIESIVAVTGYFIVFQKTGQHVSNWIFDKLLAKNLLKESWPLILSGLAISLSLRIDQIMLNEFVPKNELGFYAVGVRLAELTAFLPIVIAQSIFPKMVQLDFIKQRKRLGQMIRYVFFPLCLISLIVGLLSEFIVPLLYGVEFIKSSYVLSVLIWTIPMTYLGSFTNKLLNIEGKQQTIFYKQLTLTLLNIILNLILIPKYGIFGAAWATLIADAIVNIFLDLVFSNARWIFYLKMRSLLLINLKY